MTKRPSLLLCFGVALWAGALPSRASAAVRRQPPADSPCAYAAKAPYPYAYISNGSVDAVVYLPDAEHGSYRSSRFDWSGVIRCLSYKGHTYFGAWSNNTDPKGNDTITGPVEEFRGKTGEIGYDQAKPGESFLKIGVGLLQRIDDKPYHFGVVYPILDHGVWSASVHKRSITFRQKLRTPLGYAYTYEKTLELSQTGPTLSLSHRLTNTGEVTIDSDVYDHDFFVLDNQTVGPGFAVSFGFTPVTSTPFPSELVTWRDKELVFTDTPRQGLAAQGYLTGFNGQPGEYRFKVEDRKRQIGILQTSDAALTRVYFWSTARTICPEAYIGLHASAGETQHWRIQYTFEAP